MASDRDTTTRSDETPSTVTLVGQPERSGTRTAEEKCQLTPASVVARITTSATTATIVPRRCLRSHEGVSSLARLVLSLQVGVTPRSIPKRYAGCTSDLSTPGSVRPPPQTKLVSSLRATKASRSGYG